jgi:hypothetical protein
LFSIGCLVLLAGLACNQPQSGATMLEPKPQSYWTDIPVPKNFNRDEKKSNNSVSPGRRTIDDVYVGPDAALAVKNFYMHNMKIAGWNALTQDDREGPVYTLVFRKSSEKAEIRIERVPASIMGQRTQIRAKVNAANP